MLCYFIFSATEENRTSLTEPFSEGGCAESPQHQSKRFVCTMYSNIKTILNQLINFFLFYEWSTKLYVQTLWYMYCNNYACLAYFVLLWLMPHCTVILANVWTYWMYVHMYIRMYVHVYICTYVWPSHFALYYYETVTSLTAMCQWWQ